MFGLGLNIKPRKNRIDSDAQAFFNRVTVAGGTLSSAEKTATNKLVLDLKSAGIWSSMKAIYPMVGASASACAQNLKSSSFTGTFSSGWTFASTGVTPNGTSAFFNTNLNQNVLNYNSQSLTYYSRNNLQGASDMGVQGSYRNNLALLRTYGGQINSSVSDLQNAGLGSAQTDLINDSRGLYSGVRTSASLNKLYRNGSLFATNISDWLVIVSLNLNFYIGASNTNGSPAGYSAHECAFASIGDGLTDTQASNLYTNVQTFNTTLGRQV